MTRSSSRANPSGARRGTGTCMGFRCRRRSGNSSTILLRVCMSTMTGGEAIVASLWRHGIDTVFALPGAQIYGLFDALYDARDSIRTIGARHEQACGYMALGCARSTGKPAVYA